MLPPLREELDLYPGARLADGQPSWTLHDPVRNQFYQIDWPSFELLRHWQLGLATRIVDAVRDTTTLALGEADVAGMLDFLLANELLQPQAGQSRDFAARLQRRQGGVWTWLLHHYLFFRVPLLRPDALLDSLLPRLRWLFTRQFALLTLLAAVLGLHGVMTHWAAYSATLVDNFSWQGLAAYGVTIAVVKVLHEFAHGLTAKRFGCRVPTMGVALMVLWPVAYTDTTEVWKLPSARQRMAVAGAGIGAELVIATWATLAWLWLPPGSLSDGAFLASSTTWISTLLVNASPFMRFDGYFLLSDAVEMPNLHRRAFALARWNLREILFGLGEPAPEAFPRRKTLALVGFAWVTWLYRLSLFLGIAFLVYHFVIKAVGIALFSVEMVWFIASPVWSEVSVWWRLRDRIGVRRRALLALLVLALVLLMLVPLPGQVTVTGLLEPARAITLYAPAGAQVTSLPYRPGDAVAKGAELFALDSPELRRRALQARARTEGVQGALAASNFDGAQRRDWQLTSRQLDTTVAESQTVVADAMRYAPRAPFAGVFYDRDPELATGDWVAQGEVLGRIVSTDAPHVVTYVDEADIQRIAVGDDGLFIVAAPNGPTARLRVLAIERDAARVLPEKLLASQLGGQILVREQGEVFYPEAAVYRVTLVAVTDPGHATQTWRGLVSISARPQALVTRLIDGAASSFWREAGF